jgi:hypothetical protein
MPPSAELVTGLLAAFKAGVSCLVSGRVTAVTAVTAGPAGCATPPGEVLVPAAGTELIGFPVSRPPRAACDHDAYVAWPAIAPDLGTRVRHQDLVNRLLSVHLATAPAVPALGQRPVGCLNDLIATVFLPLITGATLVVWPEAVATH